MPKSLRSGGNIDMDLFRLRSQLNGAAPIATTDKQIDLSFRTLVNRDPRPPNFLIDEEGSKISLQESARGRGFCSGVPLKLCPNSRLELYSSYGLAELILLLGLQK